MGNGSKSQAKKALISEGKLDKFGRPNDNTPQKWKQEYEYYTGDVAPNKPGAVKQEKTETPEVQMAEITSPVSSETKQKKEKKEKKEKKRSAEEAGMEIETENGAENVEKPTTPSGEEKKKKKKKSKKPEASVDE